LGPEQVRPKVPRNEFMTKSYPGKCPVFTTRVMVRICVGVAYFSNRWCDRRLLPRQPDTLFKAAAGSVGVCPLPPPGTQKAFLFAHMGQTIFIAERKRTSGGRNIPRNSSSHFFVPSNRSSLNTGLPPFFWGRQSAFVFPIGQAHLT